MFDDPICFSPTVRSRSHTSAPHNSRVAFRTRRRVGYLSDILPTELPLASYTMRLMKVDHNTECKESILIKRTVDESRISNGLFAWGGKNVLNILRLLEYRYHVTKMYEFNNGQLSDYIHMWGKAPYRIKEQNIFAKSAVWIIIS